MPALAVRRSQNTRVDDAAFFLMAKLVSIFQFELTVPVFLLHDLNA
jgi:hypothetical protein